jgi:ssDNA thymidine ADP-ribosyltransferase, DarT
VERQRLRELQFITPIANVKSILERGILSHEKAKTLNPRSIAKAEVQERRAARRVPGGRPLHDSVGSATAEKGVAFQAFGRGVSTVAAGLRASSLWAIRRRKSARHTDDLRPGGGRLHP